jgi:hypothetical protein
MHEFKVAEENRGEEVDPYGRRKRNLILSNLPGKSDWPLRGTKDYLVTQSKRKHEVNVVCQDVGLRLHETLRMGFSRPSSSPALW